MKKVTLLLVYICFSFYGRAQFERTLPLEGNPDLPTNSVVKPAVSFKTGSTQAIFPLVDDFEDTLLNTTFWADSGVTIQAGSVTFNAQNSEGLTYSNADNSFGRLDELTSKSINAIGFAENCYITFSYQTGATWQSNDSLVLQALNAAGNWDNIWRSVPNATSGWLTAQFNFGLGALYQHAGLKFKLVNFGTRSTSQTASYQVANFVFASKNSWPLYENFFWTNSHSHRFNWAKMQGELRVDTSLKFSQVIHLNAYSISNVAYGNGWGDTIQSNLINLSDFYPSDSVYLRFYAKSYTALGSDSLLVQLKNNGGQWLTQLVVPANNATNWKSYQVGVNRNRFNHANFEFRLISKGNSTDTLTWKIAAVAISKKLSLPFVDDFSSTQTYPNAQQWMDKSVFINNRFPVRPPSLNVATFDGLNAWGVPYGVGRGTCDTLTSFPINLSGLTAADSVYLSFYIQPKGLGMIPDLGDSLNLYARYSSASIDSFLLLWQGAPTWYFTDSFVRVNILLTSPFLHDEFQLRFVNKGSRTGNLSHWHLDYIYLNKGRTASDAITDLAIQNTPSSLLKTYASMPYHHYRNQAANYTRDTQYFSVKNNSNQSYAIDYGREIFDQNFARIDTFGSIISIMPAQASRSANIKKNVTLAGNFTTDSVWVWSRFYTRLGTSADNIPANDTLWQGTYFGNYYAYDDGTAEAGYAIENSPGKVALGYEFAQPDSMYGMSVYFNRGKVDVSGLSFNLKVWSALNLTSDVEVLTIPASTVYYNERNRFYYVKFNQPIYVQNKVYIGWEQNSIFPLNVGLDLNFTRNDVYAPNPQLFYNVQNLWQPTELNGALMMRAIVGKWIEPLSGLTPLVKEQLQLTLYPNPTNGIVNFETSTTDELRIEVTDVLGRQHRINQPSSIQTIDLHELSAGMYWITFTSLKSGASITKKVSLQH